MRRTYVIVSIVDLDRSYLFMIIIRKENTEMEHNFKRKDSKDGLRNYSQDFNAKIINYYKKGKH